MIADDGGNEGAEKFEVLDLQLDDNIFTPVEACGGEFINSLGNKKNFTDLVKRKFILKRNF